MLYIKDGTESFDDYYTFSSNNQRRNCDLEHVYNWAKLFIYLDNTDIRNKVSIVNSGEIISS